MHYSMCCCNTADKSCFVNAGHEYHTKSTTVALGFTYDEICTTLECLCDWVMARVLDRCIS